MERVMIYIDGFNLYFGMIAAHELDKSLADTRWLNIPALGKYLLNPNQVLTGTKYFTARISKPKNKVARQNTYLEALTTLVGPDFSIFYGRYQEEVVKCPMCLKKYKAPNEKMTDVHIGVQMVKDAFRDNFDVALLISADADLVSPIETIKGEFPLKRIVVVYPPERFSYYLQRVADRTIPLKLTDLLSNQLPQQVQRSDGFMLRRPREWV